MSSRINNMIGKEFYRKWDRLDGKGDPIATATGTNPLQNLSDDIKKRKKKKDARQAAAIAKKQGEEQGRAAMAAKFREDNYSNTNPNVFAGKLGEQPLSSRKRLSI